MNFLNKKDQNLTLFTLLLILFGLTPSALAQSKYSDKGGISIVVNNDSLHKVLSEIEKQSSYKFAYNTELILHQINITFQCTNLNINQTLDDLFKTTEIKYQIIGNQIILQKKVFEKITIRGYISDKKTGEMLIGTSIYFPKTKNGGISNNYGFFSLSVPPDDSLDIEISYAGYKTIHAKIDASNDIKMNIALTLRDDSTDYTPVIVLIDKREDNIRRNQTDLIDLSTDMIAGTTSVSGSGDVISSVQLSGGVQPGLDGSSGYFVRGGNSDQNLVLLDEACLYNPGHLFGLVSVFNSSAIKKANLLKGGFPAAYGDFLSSVLDVYMKEGSNKQFGGDLELGTIDASMTLHGPIAGDRSSFLLSARRSTIDWILRPLSITDEFTNYYFYDVNAKINLQVSPTNKFFF